MNNPNPEPIKGHRLNPIPKAEDWAKPINSVFNPETSIDKSTKTYLQTARELRTTKKSNL